MPGSWDAQFERACNEYVEQICKSTEASEQRSAAWRALLRDVAPHIEHWAKNSWLLVQWRLSSDDDARTVMVNVISRLQRNDFDNLRRYAERRQPAEQSNDAQLTAVNNMARLTREAAEPGDETTDEDNQNTPLRAWLLTLIRFSTKDYVRQRMGWGLVAGGGDKTGDDEKVRLSKRDVATDAASLSNAPEGSARPPITDYLTVRGLLEEIDEFMDSFPPNMKAAVSLWMNDVAFEDIATRLELADTQAARKLVRAGHARLRDQYRSRWSSFMG